jgi:hypothetical protein
MMTDVYAVYLGLLDMKIRLGPCSLGQSCIPVLLEQVWGCTTQEGGARALSEYISPRSFLSVSLPVI